MLNNLLLGQTAEEKLYVEDVFSTYLYSGTSATQTISNDIDLSSKGGMVWIKARTQPSFACDNVLFDTARGALKYIRSNLTDAEVSPANSLTSFNTNGFTLGTNSNGQVNYSGHTYASWTFRKAPKFFDVVTYTGNGTAGRTISHSLGVAPGMIIVKCTNASPTFWRVYHRSIGATKYMNLNNTDTAATYNGFWNDTEPTSSVFSLGNDTEANGSGRTYVAYLFAHDTTADGVIQCGSFNGSSNMTVELGWEPQFILAKRATNYSGDWYIIDNMRGMPVSSSNLASYLSPNLSAAESTGLTIYPTSTGFFNNSFTSETWIYLAIRRGPMRTPTDATKVFKPVLTTSQPITTGFPVDLSINAQPNADSSKYFVPRLTNNYMTSTSTGAESAGATYFKFDSNTTFSSGSWWGSSSNINYNFRRAPGFFDVVCYTGTGSANQDIKHNLGAYPDLIIVKSRSASSQWPVICKISNSTQSCYWAGGTSNPGLNSNAAATTFFTAGSSITTTLFKTELFGQTTGIEYNQSGTTYVAYLFASCPGVSKVGSYTGNGSSLNVDCGFTNGARFVLIKRTDSTGDWFTFDTARGIVAANDPHLSLNSTAAEVTTDDSIDPLSTGFTVNQVSATNVNVSGGAYIYLAIA